MTETARAIVAGESPSEPNVAAACAPAAHSSGRRSDGLVHGWLSMKKQATQVEIQPNPSGMAYPARTHIGVTYSQGIVRVSHADVSVAVHFDDQGLRILGWADSLGERDADLIVDLAAERMQVDRAREISPPDGGQGPPAHARDTTGPILPVDEVAREGCGAAATPAQRELDGTIDFVYRVSSCAGRQVAVAFESIDLRLWDETAPCDAPHRLERLPINGGSWVPVQVELHDRPGASDQKDPLRSEAGETQPTCSLRVGGRSPAGPRTHNPADEAEKAAAHE